MSAYSDLMGIRALFAILIAIAVLVAPALTGVNMARAAVPGPAQMMDKGHCDPGDDGEQNDAADKISCCGEICMAVAVTPGSNALTEHLRGSLPIPTLRSFQTGAPAELATPPPRAA